MGVDTSHPMLKCRDVAQLLYDYVEGRLLPHTHEALEAHLADCPGCRAFINTYRQTIRLSRELPAEAIPSELQQKLLSFIKIKQSQRRPSFWARLRSRLAGS